MKPKEHRVSLVTRLGYGSGNLVGSGALAISSAWLVIFYTQYAGLTMPQATFIYAAALLVDTFANPICGFITDAFNNTWLGRRFGRRRFFILLSIPVLGILNPLMWVVVPNGFAYYFVVYVLYNLMYTMVMIPYDALPAEMTTDYEERTYLSGLRAIFGKVANFLTAALPGIFFVVFGNDNPMAFFALGCAFGVMMAAAMTFVYITTWERPVSEETMERVASPVEGLKKLFIDMFSTLRIKTFRNLLGMYLFGFGAEWLFNSLFAYFVMYVLFLPKASASAWQSMSSILQLVSTLVVMGIVAKKGFRKPYMAAEGVVIAASIAYVLCGVFGIDAASAAGFAGITAIVVVFGLGTGAVYYIPWQAYLFVADVDEVVTGRRREGTFSAAMHLCGKLMNSAVVAALGMVMTACGYISGTSGDVTQPAFVTGGVLAVMLVGVAGLSVLGIVAAKLMRLDRETDAVVQSECARIKAGGRMEDVDPEVKRICEELSGVPYELCFGHNTIGYHTPEETARIKAEMPARRLLSFGLSPEDEAEVAEGTALDKTPGEAA